MNHFSTKILLSVLMMFLFSCSTKESHVSELKTTKEKTSYALGMDYGISLNQFKSEIDLDILVQGLRDTLEGRQVLLTLQEAKAVLGEFRQKVREERIKERQMLTLNNKKEGKAFLDENKKKAEVVTTASGLQYEVLKEGDGPKPKPTDKVSVHYRGTLIDGTEFDSSYGRGQPATFMVNGVIRGWTEALQLMNVGSKYRLYIPPELGYGERGAGQKIGPNATLIFEVELLSIEK